MPFFGRPVQETLHEVPTVCSLLGSKTEECLCSSRRRDAALVRHGDVAAAAAQTVGIFHQWKDAAFVD
jgi:hypothetical protein